MFHKYDVSRNFFNYIKLTNIHLFIYFVPKIYKILKYIEL